MGQEFVFWMSATLAAKLAAMNKEEGYNGDGVTTAVDLKSGKIFEYTHFSHGHFPPEKNVEHVDAQKIGTFEWENVITLQDGSGMKPALIIKPWPESRQPGEFSLENFHCITEEQESRLKEIFSVERPGKVTRRPVIEGPPFVIG